MYTIQYSKLFYIVTKPEEQFRHLMRIRVSNIWAIQLLQNLSDFFSGGNFNDPTILKAHYVPGETFIGSPVIRKRSLKKTPTAFLQCRTVLGMSERPKGNLRLTWKLFEILSPRFATSVINTGVAP